MKYLLHIATILSILTYSFWIYFPKESFYVGNGLFIFLLCLYIFLQNRKSFIKFVLFCLSINNLLDELFFNPTELGVNELAFAISIPLIWLYKSNSNAREIYKQ